MVSDSRPEERIRKRIAIMTWGLAWRVQGLVRSRELGKLRVGLAAVLPAAFIGPDLAAWLRPQTQFSLAAEKLILADEPVVVAKQLLLARSVAR